MLSGWLECGFNEKVTHHITFVKNINKSISTIFDYKLVLTVETFGSSIFLQFISVSYIVLYCTPSAFGASKKLTLISTGQFMKRYLLFILLMQLFPSKLLVIGNHNYKSKFVSPALAVCSNLLIFLPVFALANTGVSLSLSLSLEMHHQ